MIGTLITKHLRRELPRRSGSRSSFPDATYRALAEAGVLHLQTTDRVSGRIRQSRVWVVGVDGRLYVRSRRGAWRGWHRDLRADGHADVWIDGRMVPSVLLRVDDPERVDRVTAAYRTKYATEPDLGRMLHRDACESTFEVRPARRSLVGRTRAAMADEMWRWKLAVLIS